MSGWQGEASVTAKPSDPWCQGAFCPSSPVAQAFHIFTIQFLIRNGVSTVADLVRCWIPGKGRVLLVCWSL